MASITRRRTQSGGAKTRLLIAIGVVAALFCLVILVDFAVANNHVHPRVSLSGYAVGGMSPEEARAEVQKQVDRSQAQQIVLVHNSKRWDVAPADVDTRIDVARSVAAAYAIGRDGNFLSDIFARIALLFSSRDLPLQGAVNSAKMDELLSSVAKELDKPAVNAGLDIEDGVIEVVEDREGLIVDRNALRDKLKDLLFSLHATELAIPMKVDVPAVRAAETDGAVQQARTMISAPVVLKYKDMDWTLEPEELEETLGFRVTGEGENSRLVAYVSPDKAKSFLNKVAKEVTREPKNATFQTDGKVAWVVEAQVGRTLDRPKTAEALTAAALSTERVAQAALKEVQPKRTTEQAKKMGISVKIGAYTTEYGGSDNRRDNIARAAKIIDGTLIAPGAEFDFDSVVGPRTEANGFKTAPVIVSGGKLEDSLGGGICQVATTLFNAAFFAGLEITERHNHSLYISHYPKGRDATVTWGGAGFRFRNDTQHWILIRSASSRSSVTFGLYGAKLNRKVTYSTTDFYDIQPVKERRVKNAELAVGQTKVINEGQTGKSVKVTRKVVENGKTIHSDTFVSRYPMYERVIEEGSKPVTTTSTTEKPGTTTTTEPGSTATTVKRTATTTKPAD